MSISAEQSQQSQLPIPQLLLSQPKSKRQQKLLSQLESKRQLLLLSQLKSKTQLLLLSQLKRPQLLLLSQLKRPRPPQQQRAHWTSTASRFSLLATCPGTLAPSCALALPSPLPLSSQSTSTSRMMFAPPSAWPMLRARASSSGSSIHSASAASCSTAWEPRFRQVPVHTALFAPMQQQPQLQ